MDVPINTNRIFGLDVMRATAILMVLCSHILWIYPNANPLIYQVFSLFGFLGVEIFFVLSGFLIGKILYKIYLQDNFRIHSVFYFLKRRWFRTLPNYFLVLLLNIIIAYFIGISVKDIGLYFFFLQNFASTMNPFFPESWSLSVEEFTYLFVPFALLIFFILVKPKNKSKSFVTVIAVLIALFVFTKIYYQFTTQNTTLIQWNVSLKAVVIYRIDSILIGILASWFYLNYAEFWRKQKLVLAFIGLILFVLMFAGVGFFGVFIEKYPFFWNVIYLPITSIIFSLFLPFLSQLQTASKWFSKPITFVSLISYSIYLLHYSIILLLMKYWIDTKTFSNAQLHLFTFSYIIITFFLSFLLYKYFEKPIMNLRENKELGI